MKSGQPKPPPSKMGDTHVGTPGLVVVLVGNTELDDGTRGEDGLPLDGAVLKVANLDAGEEKSPACQIGCPSWPGNSVTGLQRLAAWVGGVDDDEVVGALSLLPGDPRGLALEEVVNWPVSDMDEGDAANLLEVGAVDCECSKGGGGEESDSSNECGVHFRVECG